MNSTELQSSLGLMDFLDNCPTSYHTVDKIKSILDGEGFHSLDEKDPWVLESGKGYYIERNRSSLAAFTMGSEPPESGFLIAAAHTDSPGLKLKIPSGERFFSGSHRGLSTIPVEVYGGPILSTWLDRDLSIAGIVQIKEKRGFKPVLFDLKRPVAVIPNAAIHFNREINKGFEYNPQIHLRAMVSGSGSDNKELSEIISREIASLKEDLGPFDLFFYDVQKGCLAGFGEEFLVSGRIDNLAGCHGILSALLSIKDPEMTVGGFFFDNEEIGSRTMQGADSAFLADVLDRIVMVRGGTAEDCYRSRAASFLISVDGAHALHPNFPEKHDQNFAPCLNQGPVIKLNAGFRYATTSEGAARFEEVCRKADLPLQKFAMRSDLPCGTTIGAMSSALSGIKTLDVGIPMLAMHSIRETAGVHDQKYMIRALSEFFRSGR